MGGHSDQKPDRAFWNTFAAISRNVANVQLRRSGREPLGQNFSHSKVTFLAQTRLSSAVPGFCL